MQYFRMNVGTFCVLPADQSGHVEIDAAALQLDFRQKSQTLVANPHKMAENQVFHHVCSWLE